MCKLQHARNKPVESEYVPIKQRVQVDSPAIQKCQISNQEIDEFELDDPYLLTFAKMLFALLTNGSDEEHGGENAIELVICVPANY